mgnify:CR=1 FL=1|tara:strand:- start:73 stop:402 length:330 start_codon:yes stop_codon:yes gene_type:complete
MSKLRKKYLQLGIKDEKIIETEMPSVVIWSLSRKRIVGGKGQEPAIEIIKQPDGNARTSYENNRMVTMQIHKEGLIPVNKINQSDGIIVTDETYGLPYYRFGYIPNKDE